MAYVVVACGIFLAFVIAVAPWYTGSYRLHADYLIFGIIPYIVYGSLTGIVRGYPLAVAGLSLLAVDLVARLVADVTSAAQPDAMPAIRLCALQLLVVLPAGAVLGMLFSRRRT